MDQNKCVKLDFTSVIVFSVCNAYKSYLRNAVIGFGISDQRQWKAAQIMEDVMLFYHGDLTPRHCLLATDAQRKPHSALFCDRSTMPPLCHSRKSNRERDSREGL